MELNHLISIRKKLHQNPELSGKEEKTANYIKQHLRQTNPDKIIDHLGGHGLSAIYEFGKGGPCVMLRCE